MRSRWSVCLQEAAVALVLPPASYSRTARLWQHWTGRAQRGLPVARDQADLGPDITSISPASPSPALCCKVQLTMPCLCAVLSSMQGRGNANLTAGWLTTAGTVANRLIFMCYCFQCPTSQRELTALLTSYVVSLGDIYTAKFVINRCMPLRATLSENDSLLFLFKWTHFNLKKVFRDFFRLKCFPFKIKAKQLSNPMKMKCTAWKLHKILSLRLCPNERGQKERVKRRQDGVLSGRLVSTQSCVLSTGGCGGFIKLHIHSPCTWVTGPYSQCHPSLAPQITPLLSRPSGCPALTRGVLQLEEGIKRGRKS